MGDRTYLHITLHGCIETVEAFDKIVKALEAEYLFPDDDSGEIVEHIKSAVASGNNPGFHDRECNYANIERAENALQDHKVPYHVEHEEGGDYSAGCWSWSPEHGKVKAVFGKDGTCLTVEDVRNALDNDDPAAALEAVEAMIERADIAGGAGLPPFSLSDEVRVHLGLDPAAPEQREAVAYVEAVTADMLAALKECHTSPLLIQSGSLTALRNGLSKINNVVEAAIARAEGRAAGPAGVRRCPKCGAGPAGNCGYYGAETPRETCPLKVEGRSNG